MFSLLCTHSRYTHSRTGKAARTLPLVRPTWSLKGLLMSLSA